MAFIYDNLVATLIATTVVLILGAIQMEAIQTNTGRTSRNTVNTQAQQLANWLEEDLSRIGQNMPPEVDPYDGPEGPGDSDPPQWSADWHTVEFSFDYRDADGDLQEVEYELVNTGNSAEIEGQEDVPLARLERLKGSVSGSMTPDGRATNLGYFKVDFLNASGEPGASGGDIELVRARFSVIAPFQNEDTIPRRARRSVVVPYRSD